MSMKNTAYALVIKVNYTFAPLGLGKIKGSDPNGGSLFVSFRFFNTFPKQPFRHYYTQPQPPPASRSPNFSLTFYTIFCSTPKTLPLPSPTPPSPPIKDGWGDGFRCFLLAKEQNVKCRWIGGVCEVYYFIKLFSYSRRTYIIFSPKSLILSEIFRV